MFSKDRDYKPKNGGENVDFFDLANATKNDEPESLPRPNATFDSSTESEATNADAGAEDLNVEPNAIATEPLEDSSSENSNDPTTRTQTAEPSNATPELSTSQAVDDKPIFNAVDAIREQIERLRVEFQNKIKYDAKKDAHIDALYSENREYRDDLIWAVKKSLLEDLVALVDSLDGGLEVYREIERKGETTPEKFKKLLKYVDGAVEDLLYALEKHDVVSYREPENAPFNPNRQRAVEVRSTDDPTKDRATLSKRRGYEIEGKRIVRKEGVVCFRYEAKTETKAPNAEKINVATVETTKLAIQADATEPTRTEATSPTQTPYETET